MSDVSHGPGWWLAVDGKWYAPERHPDPEHRARFALAPPTLPPPVPQAPEPYVAKLKAGGQLVLGVNLRHIDPGAVRELLGRPREDMIERTVRVRMFRDVQSQYPDSVKVTTQAGHLVGWVLKDDSPLACRIVDHVTYALRTSTEVNVGPTRPVIFDVSARLEGEWECDGDDWSGDVSDLELRIADPVQVDTD
jgi:hypothetical protein